MALLAPPARDGSEIYDNLCHHFLQHDPLRQWLMNHYPAESPLPRDIDQGIAFCCAFPVPQKWASIASSFAMGEMMVPVRTYGRFLCGVIVAGTNIHKYAACITHVLDSYSSPDKKPAAFRAATRRIVCDVGVHPDDPINIIDFAWMEDTSLIVCTKVLTAPVEGLHPGSCTGSFGIYYNPSQRGKVPSRPDFVVSYAEVPHCFLCAARGISSGCICTSVAGTRAAPIYLPPPPTPAAPSHLFSPPSLAPGAALFTRIGSINKCATMRISARKGVWRPAGPDGAPSYSLDRICNQVQVAVRFSMASDYHFHALRQVAAISTSFGGPANIASARLLLDGTAPDRDARDARDEFRKRHAINTEILQALVAPEKSVATGKQEPSLSTEQPASSGATLPYIDDIDFSFAQVSAFTTPNFPPVPLPGPGTAPAPAFELSPVNAMDKIALDKFFPYRPSLETAHHVYAPPSSRLVSQFLESPQYASKPVDAVAAFLDLAAAPNPPHAGTPAPQCIGAAASPVTPALDDPALALPTPATRATVKVAEDRGEVAGADGAAGAAGASGAAAVEGATGGAGTAKRVRHVPSSGVCAVCGKYFFKSGALVRHTRSAHPEVAVARESRGSSGSGSGGGTGSSSGSSSGGRHPAARLDCPRCPKTFSQQGSLNRHLRSIHEARKLHCRYCDLAFGQAFDLKRHQRRKHPGSVPVVPAEALPRNFAMRERPFCDVRQEG